MKILHRHVLKEFLKILSITLASLTVLFLVINVVEKLDDLVNRHVGFGEGVKYFLFKIPAILPQITPVAVLLSTLLSISLLNKYGEITAIKAGGIGLFKALRPLFWCGIFMSGAILLVNEYVSPPAARVIDSIEGRRIGAPRLPQQGASKGGVGRANFFGSGGLWFRAGDSFVNVRGIDFGKRAKILHGINVYEIEKPFVLVTHVSAKEAAWKNDRWIAENATVARFGKAQNVEETVQDYVFTGISMPEELLNAETSYKKMSISGLKNYIKGLEDDGYDTTKYRVELFSKISFPLVNFIMVLVAVPFGLKSGRGTSAATGVGLSVVIGFTYWIIFGITSSLGQNGIIPPILAAFFPDILFTAIGILMLGYVRQ